MALADQEIRKFHTKYFSLFHHQSSMKVGMDSILLGIWTDPSHSKNILDVGTGSGIISLILAAKTKAKIEAIDLDKSSVTEAIENINSSPFHHRISVCEKNFIDLSIEKEPTYDLIVTNPPFFVNDSRSEESRKKHARHSDSLSFQQLIDGSAKLLLPDGKLSLVLPYEESRIFLKLADEAGFKLQKQQLIFPVRGLPPNRINMQFGFNSPVELKTDKLVIREENRNFSEEYKNYVKELMIGIL